MPAGELAHDPRIDLESTRFDLAKLMPTRRLQLGVLVAAITTVAFLPVLGNGWIDTIDDRLNFLENPQYRGLGPSQIFWAFSTFQLGVYQPLAWVLLEAQYVLFGLVASGYHLTSLCLHVANALVLMALIIALLNRCPSLAGRRNRRAIDAAAALAALLFAVHPLRVEVVAWASCQPYLPCGFFAILATLAYLRRNLWDTRSQITWLTLAWVFYAMALLCKAAAAMLPVVLLVLDAFPLRRFSLVGPSRWTAIRAALLEKVPFALVCLFFMAAALSAKYLANPINTSQGGGLATRLLAAGYSAWFYIEKTVWPSSLSIFYEWSASDPSSRLQAAAGVLGFAALTGMAVWLARHQPGPLAGWLAYLALLAPVSGLVRSSHGTIVADRYAYVATMPLFAMLAYTLAWLWTSSWMFGRLPLRNVPFAVCTVAVLALGVISWRLCQTWRNHETLIAHAVESGTLSRARYLVSLGSIREQERRFAEAESWYREAVQLAPRMPEALGSLGAFLFRKGDSEEGKTWLERSILIDPDYFVGYHDLGVVLARQGKLDEAVCQFETALRINPYYIEARCNLALVLAEEGRSTEAAEQFTRVLQGDPANPRAQRGLAMLLSRSSQPAPKSTAPGP
jgi:tetratricopeptide (TPR) repeat protein